MANKTQTFRGDVDDGPRFFYGNLSSYKTMTDNLANKLGRKVVNYIVPDEELEDHSDTEYPNGPPPAVSFFPVGDTNAENAGTNYYNDVTDSQSYQEYLKLAKRIADRVNQKIIDMLQ